MGIGTPFTVLSTATRHAMDINLTFGSASSRYDAREKYRTSYSAPQRLGAGLGVAFGTAIPAMALGGWVLKKGLRTPLAPGGLVASGSAKAVGLAALGGATAVGAIKMKQLVEDDGHFGSVGAAGGIVAGTLGGLAAGTRFAGKYAPLVSGAGAIIGGIAGYQGGKLVKYGKGHLDPGGTPAPATPRKDDGAADRAKSFAWGAFNHFNEVGPTTQGVSFGSAWGMRKSYKETSTNAERSGAMAGDLLAAGILGGGALAISGKLMRGNVAGAADAAGAVLAKGNLVGNLTKLNGFGSAGAGAAALGIAGFMVAKERSRSADNGDSAMSTNLKTAGLVAATAGTAALVSRTAGFKGLAATPKLAASALTAAALIGVLSSARLPVQQFLNDAQDAHDLAKVDSKTVYGATALGGGLAGFGAFKLADKMIPAGGVQIGKFHIPRGVLVGAGAAVGLAAGGGVGWGLSATMPDVKKVGIAAVGGAAAGAAFGGWAKGVGLPAGIVGGALLGMAGSAILGKDEAAAKAPASPTEVVGAAS